MRSDSLTSMRRLLLIVCFASALDAAPTAAPVSPLVSAFRARIAEAIEMEQHYGGGSLFGLTGDSLQDLAKVDFIVSATYPFPRRFVHSDDHRLVYSAVKGQPDFELEANLPAIINYMRLATASRLYHRQASTREPLVGAPAGRETIVGIARRVFDFRKRQLALIDQRRVRPSRVLTPANLGELAEPGLIEELETAHQAGRDQFTNQRNAVVFVVIGFELVISFGIAVLFLQRRRPSVVVRI